VSPDVGSLTEKPFLWRDTEGRAREALERPPFSGIGIEFESLTKLSFNDTDWDAKEDDDRIDNSHG
jgi:hypothetical protein